MKMKNKLMLFLLAVTAFIACEKVEDLPLYANGVEPVLNASATTIAAAPADSLREVLTLDWSDPKYATDSASVKYLVQIDSAGKTYTYAAVREVTGTRKTVFTARDLNNIMLGFGYEFNKPYDLYVRVISSYANNNERKISNVIKIKGTPYKTPPRVQLPTTGKLYIVGDATVGGWSNPVPVPNQELTKIDETTYGGIFKITGNKQYLILPLNGNWDNKYSVANNSLPGLNAGGEFGFNKSDNFPGPAADGLYKFVFDFQAGTFKVTSYTQQHGLPDSLVIVGGATPIGWSNPTGDTQKFTRINSTVFELASINLKAGEKFLILPQNGSWSKKYGEGDKSGFLVPEGSDIPAPAVTGNYKITIDFMDNSIRLVKL